MRSILKQSVLVYVSAFRLDEGPVNPGRSLKRAPDGLGTSGGIARRDDVIASTNAQASDRARACVLARKTRALFSISANSLESSVVTSAAHELFIDGDSSNRIPKPWRFSTRFIPCCQNKILPLRKAENAVRLRKDASERSLRVEESHRGTLASTKAFPAT
jgi:hypothetical protein